MNYESIIEAIYDHSIKTPNRLAVADNTRALDYQTFYSKICSFSEELKKQGVSKGDSVIVTCTQDTNYCISLFAVQLIGAILVPVEEDVSIDSLLRIKADTNAKYYIANGFESTELIIMKLDLTTEMVPFNSSINFPNSDDIAEILYSTGTTGDSKGVEMSHHAVVSIAEAVIDGVHMKDKNVEITPSPLSHAHGLRRLYANLLAGNSVVLIKNIINVKHFFSMIDNYSVTSIDLVPSALRIILRISKDYLGNYKDQLDYMQFGTAPITEEDKETLCRLLPNTRLYNIYGSSEGGCSTILDFSKYKNKKHCVGKPTLNSGCIIVDNNRVPINSSATNTGLLACFGAMVMNGYINNPKATSETLIDGIIYSNDEGYIDSDGFIYVIGRRDNVINVGGLKVSPEEVEEASIKYQPIADCACVGKTNNLNEQSVVLLITINNNQPFDKKDFYSYLNKHLEGYKRPKEIIIVDKIPKTFNGKIERKKLPSLIVQ